LWSALKDFVAEYGYTRLTAFQNTPNEDVAAAEVLFSDANPEALDGFLHSAGQRPVILEAMASTEPFTRAEAKLSGKGSGLETDLYPGENLFVPIPLNDAPKGLVILAGGKPDRSTVARSLIQVATETTFDRAQSLPSGDKTAGAGLLSPREASILSFAASGKTDAEIGGMLKISARTVRFHTDNAKRKLRVATRIQAVTEALRLGLIKH
jgi:DNA-binding CsgD family transcriptional regulator